MNNQAQPNSQIITLNFNAAQFDALRIFMERTEMRGHEVPRFLEIIQAMRTAASQQTQSEANPEATE